MKKIDVIVPCYNEAPRVGKILKVLSSSPYIKNIVFVDDGSTDNSSEIASRFHKVIMIKLPKNIGKGGAVKEGLKKVDTNTVFVSDSDLRGLKPEHLKLLIEEHGTDPRNYTVGIPGSHITKLPHSLRTKIFPLLDGERVLETTDLKKVTRSENSGGFGLEAWMNYYFRKKKINPSIVQLYGLADGPLRGRRSVKSLALESLDIGETYLEIYKDVLGRVLT